MRRVNSIEMCFSGVCFCRLNILNTNMYFSLPRILIHVRIEICVSHVFKMLVCEFHPLKHSRRAPGICNLCEE